MEMKNIIMGELRVARNPRFRTKTPTKQKNP